MFSTGHILHSQNALWLIFFFPLKKKKKKICICLLDARLEMEPPAKIAMFNFKKYMTTVKYKRIKAQTS